MSEKNFFLDVELDMDAADKGDFFEKTADLLMKKNIGTDKQKIVDGFFEREEIGGTLNYPGLAIPHTTGNFIKRDTILFIRTKNPIQNWQDEYPAQNFICLCLTDKPLKETLKYIEKLMHASLTPAGEKILLSGNRKQLEELFTNPEL